jgi:hypothetical protein
LLRGDAVFDLRLDHAPDQRRLGQAVVKSDQAEGRRGESQRAPGKPRHQALQQAGARTE